MSTQLLVLAKAPVPGRVKTRLCPPCTPRQAAEVAAGALVDTLRCGQHTAAARRTIVLSGRYAPPAGWYTVAQQGDDLGERIARGFADTALPGITSLLIGVDTPQVTPALLGSVYAGLSTADAVLGPAEDGGWWALALRDPYQAWALRDVPMSTPDTGDRTAAALRGRGLRVRFAATLRDVDTAADAQQVAAQCRPGAFADAVRAHLPLTVAAADW
ncbi:MAG: uncharacterized protein V7603_1196 [Micromonosporaceae bacterium]